MSEDVPTILEAAKEYKRAGWAVIPLKRGLKKPHGNWKQWETQKQTTADISKLFRVRTLNIGVVTGAISGIVVIDVDTYHGGSVDGLPDTGCIARTGKGGFHYFYKHPGGHAKTRAGGIADRPGIDVRGDGGYVVAAPSDTTDDPKGGGAYTWIKFDPDALADAPSWAFESGDTHTHAEHDDSQRQEPWVSRILNEGAPDGERNSTLTRLAGYFAKKGFAYDMMLASCRIWNESKVNPPLPDAELVRTVQQVYKTEQKTGRKHTEQEDPAEAARLDLMPIGEYIRTYGGVETAWLVDGWLPMDTIAMAVSPPQSYKTYAVFDLAVSVASGAPFLGKHQVRRRGPVFIFQQEDPRSNIAERIALITHTRMQAGAFNVTADGTLTVPAINDNELPIYVHTERKLKFDNPAVMDELERLVIEYKPLLVIIDPLYSAGEIDDYMAKTAQQMMRLKDIRDRHHVSFVIVHHTKKAMDSWNREKLWGSQFLNAFVETSWLMRAPPNDVWTIVLRHFKTEGPQPFTRLTFDINTKDYPHHYTVIDENVSAEEAERLVAPVATPAQAGRSDKPHKLEADVLRVLSTGDAMTIDEIAGATGVIEADVMKALRQLIYKHRVTQDALQRYTSLDAVQVHVES